MVSYFGFKKNRTLWLKDNVLWIRFVPLNGRQQELAQAIIERHTTPGKAYGSATSLAIAVINRLNEYHEWDEQLATQKKSEALAKLAAERASKKAKKAAVSKPIVPKQLTYEKVQDKTYSKATHVQTMVLPIGNGQHINNTVEVWDTKVLGAAFKRFSGTRTLNAWRNSEVLGRMKAHAFALFKLYGRCDLTDKTVEKPEQYEERAAVFKRIVAAAVYDLFINGGCKIPFDKEKAILLLVERIDRTERYAEFLTLKTEWVVDAFTFAIQAGEAYLRPYGIIPKTANGVPRKQRTLEELNDLFN